MIRALIASLALVLVLSSACKHPATPATIKTRDKRVTIIVSPDSTQPGHYNLTTEPESIYLSRGHHEVVKWCVDFRGTDADDTLVSIGNFVKEGDSSRKDPFGSQPIDNVFDIAYYDFNCKRKTKEARSDLATDDSFKYTVVFKVKGVEQGRQDPHVIIGD
jgi:hypothetical protein